MTMSAQPTPAHLTRKHSGSVERLVHEKPIPLRLAEKELTEAHDKARAEGRSASNFCRLIHLMGMARYREVGRVELSAADIAANG